MSNRSHDDVIKSLHERSICYAVTMYLYHYWHAADNKMPIFVRLVEWASHYIHTTALHSSAQAPTKVPEQHVCRMQDAAEIKRGNRHSSYMIHMIIYDREAHHNEEKELL